MIIITIINIINGNGLKKKKKKIEIVKNINTTEEGFEGQTGTRKMMIKYGQ